MIMSHIASRLKRTVRCTVRSLGFDIVRYKSSVVETRLLEDPRVFDSSSLSFVRLLKLHDIDLILDVGANTGQYAACLFGLGYCGRIVSFEPTSVAYSQLVNASVGNELWQVAERCAIGEADGEVEIHVAVNSETSSILPVLNSSVEAFPDSRSVASEKVKMRSSI